VKTNSNNAIKREREISRATGDASSCFQFFGWFDEYSLTGL